MPEYGLPMLPRGGPAGNSKRFSLSLRPFALRKQSGRGTARPTSISVSMWLIQFWMSFAAMASVWKRCDPLRSLQEGFESDNYFNGTAAQLYEDLSKYLQLGWLRHPSVDWIFLDIMVTRELCPLAEEIKQMLFPGKKDSITGVHHKYWKAKGNVSEMAAPSGLARLWGPSREFTDPNSPFAKAMQLWEAMYGTWNSLRGPVINPMMVRDEMIKSKTMGAVWPGPSWALIERVIELDRSVWLVGPYSH